MLKFTRRRVGAGLVLATSAICLLLVAIGYSASSFRAKYTSAQSNNQNQPKAPKRSAAQASADFKRTFPTVDYDAPEPTDPIKKATRAIKNKHYDKRRLISRQPTAYWSMLASEWDVGIPALPISQSNAILLVQVLNSEAHLSEDKTGIYSEFSVKIEEVFKGDAAALAKDDIVNTTRVGGVVRYRTGEESLAAIVGQNMPRIGKHYLVFLKSIEQSPDFEIITAYEIGNSKVRPLDGPAQFKVYDGADSTIFLSSVRDAIVQAQQ